MYYYRLETKNKFQKKCFTLVVRPSPHPLLVVGLLVEELFFAATLIQICSGKGVLFITFLVFQEEFHNLKNY